MTLSEGQTVGNYRILRKLGEGGMGAVYEVQHTEIGRHAAIKILHAQFSQNQQIATRFLNEAKAANRFDHPGVVEIYDSGRLPDGTTYIVMEFLKGDSLAKRLERGPMGLDTLRIARQIASVLAAAHAVGIIHRDLKPDNVIIVKDPEAPGGERAKVLDFGIAKIAEEQVMKTQAGTVLGTPAYMAPEQCRGAAGVTDKSDVYALGVMMYEMLCGRTPFVGEGIGEIMAAHMFNEPPPLRELAPSVEPALAAFVHRLLSKDPTARPNMRELIDQLERLGAARTGVLKAVDEPVPMPHKVASPADKTMAGVEGPPPPTHSTGVLPNRTGGTLALPDGDPAGIANGNRPVTMGGAGSQRTLVIGGVLAVCLIGVGISVALLLRGDRGKKPRPRPPITDMGGAAGVVDPTPEVKKPKKKQKNRRGPGAPVPEGMVFVPGTRFEMGSTAEEIDAAFKLCQARGTKCRRDLYQREQPRRTVAVRDFFLDETEVTNGQLAAWLNGQKGLKLAKKQFVNAGKALLLNLLSGTSGVEYDAKWKKAKKAGPYVARDGFAERPAVLLTWALADRYCAAQGKRLPSEAEWELAARGPEGRTFPWGEELPKCDQLAFGRGSDLPENRGCPHMSQMPDPVRESTFDKTEDGALGLGGNVAEWVRDKYTAPYPACEGKCQDPVVEPGADDPKELRVVRGGNFNLPLDASRGAGRSRLAADQALPDLGFRCAKTVTQP